MSSENTDDLDKLAESHFAAMYFDSIIAFAVRCVRRVQPLFSYLDSSEWTQRNQLLVESLDSAERFAKNHVLSPSLSIETNAKLHSIGDDGAPLLVGEATANLVAGILYLGDKKPNEQKRKALGSAALGTMNCAAAAAESLFPVNGDRARRAFQDVVRASETDLQYPQIAGADLLKKPLWPRHEPEWYSSSLAKYHQKLKERNGDREFLLFVWDPEALTPGEYAEIVAAIGDIARAEGAAGIERIRSQGFGIPSRAEVG